MILIDILLWILKWIGILLLALLGLLIFLVLLVLLAPIRYRGRLHKGEEPEDSFFGEGRVTWLNPILRICVRYEGKKLIYRVRLFGICIINSEKPKKEKKEKKKKKEENVAEYTANEAEPVAEEESTLLAEATDGAENVPAEPTSSEGEISGTGEEPATEEPPEQDEKPEEQEKSEKVSFFAKIKGFFDKIKAFFVKLKNLGANVKKQVSLLWYKKGLVMSFLKDEVQRLAFGKAWRTVKKVLGHIVPQKIKGHVEFGTGNPESTGKALAGLAMFYGKYGKFVRIVPDFTEKRLVADVSFKGRIRLGTLARLGLSLIRDKNVKGFRKNWKKLLKELKKKAE